MQLKLDYQRLILLIGEGHIVFNGPCSHALEDPVKPTGKPFLDGHMLRMCPQDFQDVRDFFSYINDMLERRSSEGTLQTE